MANLEQAIDMCIARGLSVTLESVNKKRVNGRDAFYPNGRPKAPDDIPADKIIQGKVGFRVRVSGAFCTDDNGNELIHPNLEEVSRAIIYLMRS